MDTDPFFSERLDPVNIRPDPKPCLWHVRLLVGRSTNKSWSIKQFISSINDQIHWLCSNNIWIYLAIVVSPNMKHTWENIIVPLMVSPFCHKMKVYLSVHERNYTYPRNLRASSCISVFENLSLWTIMSVFWLVGRS